MKDTMGIIFTYKNDEALKSLTQKRAVASIPYGGRYRIVDFALSNLVNSGVTKVGIITRNNYQSLMDHLGTGTEWDLSRKRDGLYILPPFSQVEDYGAANYRGRMEAMNNAGTFIRRSTSEYVIMSDADCICNLTFDEALEFHKQKKADITLFYKKGSYGQQSYADSCFLDVDDDGRVTDVTINPAVGRINLSMGQVIIGKSLLESLVQECVSHNLYSFKRDVLQRKLHDLKIYGYEYKGYYALIDSVAAYYQANMDLLNESLRMELFYEGNQIFTKIRDEVPTLYRNSSDVRNSLLADGCVIEGTVENSILFRGVRVRKGAKVSNSIIMQDCEIQANTQLNYVISDKDVVIRENRKLFGFELFPMVLAKGRVV